VTDESPKVPQDPLSVQAGKKDTILAAHVRYKCEAHDAVIRSYYQQIHRLSKADATTSMQNLGEHDFDLKCKRGSFGQSEAVLIPRSSVRFRQNPSTQIPKDLTYIDPQSRVLNYC